MSETAQYMLSTSENIKNHKPMGMANNEGNAGNALSLGMSFYFFDYHYNYHYYLLSVLVKTYK